MSDLTSPLNVSPTLAASQNFSLAASLSALITALIEPTARLLCSFTSRITNLAFVLSRTFRSAFLGRPLCDAGINTLTPAKLAITPPLTTLCTVPSSTVSSSLALMISSKPFCSSTFFLESITIPSWSLIFVTIRSTSSPTLTMSAGVKDGSSVNSFSGT